MTAAYDPNFAEVYEKRNSALVNCGMGLCKYTGARGKSGASDASAELVAYVRGVLDRADVVWQMPGFRCCPCTPPLRRWGSWTAI